MSMKFDRHLDAEVVQMAFLGDDWTKMAFLLADRYLEFHSAAGRHYRTRIPKHGRDLVMTDAADLLVAADSPEVYRLNLDQGRFLKGYTSKRAVGFTCADQSKRHGLLAFGAQTGDVVECWDPRTRGAVGATHVLPWLNEMDPSIGVDSGIVGQQPFEISSIQLHSNGLNMAVGTSSGHVLMYDLRSSKPYVVKDHNYGLPIIKVRFHEATNRVVSADRKIVKIWDHAEGNRGKTFTTIEPTADINDVCVLQDTGMMFMAGEQERVQIYYVPEMGPAPRWASFVDNITEELEEEQGSTVYDDYKFVTREDLDNLGLSHLVGTNLLRGYMHGFFMDMRLYKRAKAVVEPFAYDAYRKQKIADALNAKRSDRIAIRKKVPKVNKELARELIATSKGGKKKAAATAALTDERFGRLFTDTDFTVDRESEEYRIRNPNKPGLVEDDFDEVDAEEDADEDVDELEGRPESDEDVFSDESDGDEDDDEAARRASSERVRRELAAKERKAAKAAAQRKVREFRLKDTAAGSVYTTHKRHRKDEARKTMGDRVRDLDAKKGDEAIVDVKKSAGGGREMTFTMAKEPPSERALREQEHYDEARKRKRRGVEALGFKSNERGRRR